MSEPLLGRSTEALDLHGTQCGSEMDTARHHATESMEFGSGPTENPALGARLRYRPLVRRTYRCVHSPRSRKGPRLLRVGGDNYPVLTALPRRFVAMDRCMARLRFQSSCGAPHAGPFRRASKRVARVLDDLRELPLILVRESESLEYLRANGISDNVRLRR